MSLFQELKRRKVFRTAFAYVVMAWLLLQVTDVLIPIVEYPDWVGKLVFFFLLGGLPIVVILAWVFDLNRFGLSLDDNRFTIDPEQVAQINSLKQQRGLSQYAACFWVAFIGVGLSFGAAVTVNLHEMRFAESRVLFTADSLAREIEYRRKHCDLILTSIRAVLGDNEHLNYPEFEEVSLDIIHNNPYIRAIEWAPRVEQHQLADFANDMAETYPGFNVKQFDSQGREQPPSPKPAYFPVSYTVPKAGNEAAIGFDLSSNPDREEALLEAARQGHSLRTKTIRLVQTGEPGFLVLSPVYQGDFRPVSERARLEMLKGFAVAVIDAELLTESMVEAIQGGYPFEGEVSLYPADASPDSPFLHWVSHNPGTLSEFSSVVPVSGRFGQSWRLELRPSEAHMKGYRTSAHVIIGAVGMVLSLGLALSMHLFFNVHHALQKRLLTEQPARRLLSFMRKDGSFSELSR